MKIFLINHEPWQWTLNPDGILSLFVIGEDDTRDADNISTRNELLEGRFMYWAWRNFRDDYVGLQFRRRFLYLRPMFDGFEPAVELNRRTDLGNTCIIEIPGLGFIEYTMELADKPASAFDWINEFDCITSRPEIYGYPLGNQYCAVHRPQDWEVFIATMREDGFTDAELTIPYLHPSNIWIMKWNMFEEYMDCYWRVFNKLTERITPSLDAYQGRVFGFLLERFFSVWLSRYKERNPEVNIKLLPILKGQM